MMKKNLQILLSILCTCILIGCNNTSFISCINKSQEKEFHLYQKNLKLQFRAYELGREFNSIEPVLDSLIQVMVCCPFDTLYLVENCNPPLFAYTAILWNHTVRYMICNRSVVTTMIPNQDSLLIDLIDKWNRQKIIETSKKKPLAYFGYWEQMNLVTRIIFQDGKCIDSESIFFREIDFDAKGPIRIIE